MKLPASIFGRNDVAIDLVPKKRGRKIGWKKNYRHTLRGKGSSRFVSGSTNKKSIDLSDSSDDSDCEELLFPDNTLADLQKKLTSLDFSSIGEKRKQVYSKDSRTTKWRKKTEQQRILSGVPMKSIEALFGKAGKKAKLSAKYQVTAALRNVRKMIKATNGTWTRANCVRVLLFAPRRGNVHKTLQCFRALVNGNLAQRAIN